MTKYPMTKKGQMSNDEMLGPEPHGERPPAKEAHAYDLEERTGRFGEAVIAFAKKMPRNVRL